MERYAVAIVVGIAAGFLGRLLTLRIDYRFYPTYPHAYMTHLALGFIAAGLGAVAIPAIAKPDYVAVTFLALAAQQFRDIRSMERDTLNKLEESKMIPRGPDYIEGIARVFEARNYLVMFAALLIGGATFAGNIFYGLLTGLAALIASRGLMKGKNIGEIAHVRAGKVYFEGAKLFVDNIQLMNLGLQQVRDIYLERALGIIIEPLNDNGRATLANHGQRIAIAHDVAALLGIHKDVDTAEFTPIVRRSLDTGCVGLIIVPLEKDISVLIEAVKRVPVLESALSLPLKTTLGKRAAD